MYQLKAKYSELNAYPLSFENILKIFSNDNIKQTELNGYVHDFSVDFISNETIHLLLI